MKGYLPNKNLIFFNPGSSGIIFQQPAKQYITIEQLLKIQEHLVKKATDPVIYIEDRRTKARPRRGGQDDFLSPFGKGKTPHAKHQNTASKFYI
ncbi:MAG: hypothetical protein KAR45_09250 [Desulfobacteraceae bacterium]|nr:hypothetical protein [Desulfobacteraceae bacterium]